MARDVRSGNRGVIAPPRLVDVAAAAGVSLATASRALRDREGVSVAVAEQIRSVAEQLGYVPNGHARALAGGGAAMVGLIVHDVGDPYFSEIARGVLLVAGRHGRMVVISQVERDPQAELDRIRNLRATRVGAIVLAGSGYTDPQVERATGQELRAFELNGGRATLVGRHHLAVDAVLPDNVAGGETIGRHVLGLGHRRLAVLAGPGRLATVEDRMAGVTAAVSAHGATLPPLVVEEADFTREGGAEGTARILELAPETTAIIALNDAMAIGALAYLRQRGIDVPGRISVTGFDDVPVAADLAPALTTVRIPMAEMGQMALEMALSPAATRPRRRKTRHELVVRESTAGPRR